MNSIRFSSAAEINEFFAARHGQPYVKWFNASLATKGDWAAVRLVDTPSNDGLFDQFWNQIPSLFAAPDCSLLQFAALSSILANECRGDYKPQAEKMGRPGHQGMAYLFDKIPGVKKSYNTLAGNLNAFQCFNDDNYCSAHADGGFSHTTDTRWRGEVWPTGVPTDPNSAKFIWEADFAKFRGRGLIQTTGRSNYLHLIGFVQQYTGENPVLVAARDLWSNVPVNIAATRSKNSDWDRLFGETDLVIAVEAVRVHNAQSGSYLALTDNALEGVGPGTVHRMGIKISGGESYASLFQRRVAAVMQSAEGMAT